MGDIAQRGNRLTFAKGGRAGHAMGSIVKKVVRKFRPGVFKKGKKTHGKDVPTMAAKGGRIGLKDGTGPKPGTWEFVEHHLHKPRKKKAIGGVLKIGKKVVKKISDAARKKDTADRIKVFEHAGPHEGEVITKRILGKGTKKGDRTKAAVKDAMEAKPWVGKPHAAGGRIGKKWGKIVRPTRSRIHEMLGGGERGKPHSTKEGRQASGKRLLRRTYEAAKEHVKSKGPPSGRAEGGRIGLKHGFQILGGGVEGKPHSSREGRDDAGRRRFERWTGEDWSKGPTRPKGRRRGKHIPGKWSPERKTEDRPKYVTEGDKVSKIARRARIGLKKGGSDKKWIQKAVNPKHKGYCTPMTKKTCTPARKALARTFKKKAKTGWS